MNATSMRAHILRSCVPLLAVVLVLTAAAPGEFDAARKAYEGGDLETAFGRLVPLAEGGMAEAQYLLGRMYQRGEHVNADPAAAESWYAKAAQQNHCGAQVALSDSHIQREGIGYYEKDWELGKMDAGMRNLAAAMTNLCAPAWFRYYWYKYGFLFYAYEDIENNAYKIFSKMPKYKNKTKKEIEQITRKSIRNLSLNIAALLVISVDEEDILALENKDRVLDRFLEQDMVDVEDYTQKWRRGLVELRNRLNRGEPIDQFRIFE